MENYREPAPKTLTAFSEPLPTAPTQIGRFGIRREIGRGYSSVVYQADDPLRHRTVALKVLTLAETLSAARRKELSQRFDREARAISALSHPAIVAIYDVGQTEDGRQYIAMECLEGETLRARLQREGVLPAEEAVAIALPLADALHYAHGRGIIHRDVKPDNVFLRPDGAVKLVDFGVAQMLADQSMTQDGTIVGSPAYMSPEQINGQPLDGRSDQFSLAAMLAEMTTGTKPFEAPSIPAVMNLILNRPPQLAGVQPRALRQALTQALSKNRTGRYPSMVAFAGALRQAVEGEWPASDTSTLVKHISLLPGNTVPVYQPTRRNSKALLAAAVCALAALPLLAAGLLRQPAAAPAPVLRPVAAAARPPITLGIGGERRRIPTRWRAVTHPATLASSVPLREGESRIEESQPPAPLRVARQPFSPRPRAFPALVSRTPARPAAPNPPEKPNRPLPLVPPPGTASMPVVPQVKVASSREEHRLTDPTTPPALPIPTVPLPEPSAPAVSAPDPGLSEDPTPNSTPDGDSADTPPRLVRRAIPVVSAAALEEARAGRVRVRLWLNASGGVDDTQILQSSGSRNLDEDALDAVRHWRFDPASREGQPVGSIVDETVTFRRG